LTLLPLNRPVVESHADAVADLVESQADSMVAQPARVTAAAAIRYGMVLWKTTAAFIRSSFDAVELARSAKDILPRSHSIQPGAPDIP
jgi:hypothetical protein